MKDTRSKEHKLFDEKLYREMMIGCKDMGINEWEDSIYYTGVGTYEAFKDRVDVCVKEEIQLKLNELTRMFIK